MPLALLELFMEPVLVIAVIEEAAVDAVDGTAEAVRGVVEEEG